MYCSNCGAHNEDKNKFCSKCGKKLVKVEQQQIQAETEKPQAEVKQAIEVNEPVVTEPVAEVSKRDETNQQIEKKIPAEPKKKKSKKKVIVIIAAAIVLIAAAIAGGLFFLNSKVSAKYNGMIKEADGYTAKQDYKKAEETYIKAIAVQPKKEQAYIKLADMYMATQAYTKAYELLDDAEDITESRQISKKLDAVEPYSEFYKYLEDELVEDEGIAAVDKSFKWGDESGLLSVFIKDVDNDDVPEMITLEYGDDEYTQLTISCYKYKDDEVTYYDSYTDYYIDEDYYAGAKYEIFVKEVVDEESEFYLVVKGYQAIESGLLADVFRVYSLGDEITAECEIAVAYAAEGTVYMLDDDVIGEFEFDTEESSSANEELRQGIQDDAYSEYEYELECYGLDRKISLEGDEKIKFAGYDENDDSEIYLAYIQRGEFDSDNNLDFNSSDSRTLYDFTNFRDNVKF